MNPRVRLAVARTPDGGEMVLYRHDRDFSITIDGQDLMNSRQHGSELALARLGCAHLAGRDAPCILVGGLGLGYTLRQALNMAGPRGQVVVGELMDAVVEWHQAFLGELNGRPLEDERVEIRKGDVVEPVARSRDRFDAILMDIDNGPCAMTDSGNQRLYSRQGIEACRRALRAQGCLAVWSAAPGRKFEQRLMQCNFHVRRFRVPAYGGSKSRSCFVWVASEDRDNLPSGGRAPRRAPARTANRSRRRPRKRR